MEKICGFKTNCVIDNIEITKNKLRKHIENEIMCGNYIFVINPLDKFNKLALDVCKSVKKEFDFVQIFYNNNDYSLHQIDTLIYYANSTNISFKDLPYKHMKTINIFFDDPTNIEYNSNIRKYFSSFNLH